MIDLHTHSSVSDGSERPGRVVELAAAAGCKALALTDHDSLDGLAEAGEAAARAGLVLVAGCEVSCRKPPPPPGAPPLSGSVHVLVYFVGPGTGPLQDELRVLRQDRAERNRALAERLVELGTGVRYEDVVAEAGEEAGVGRPHFARALVKAGAAHDVDDAFDRFLADGRPAYVPKARLDPGDVARLAHASGGVAVLAHPLSTGLGPAHLERMVAGLAEEGLDGVEALYASYAPDERSALRRMAERHDLVWTGGSDFHGSFKPGLEPGTGRGDLRVPDEVVDALAARRAEVAGRP
ncbi:MAG TPA: PHP domain-containing protein [Acidimicrobiales bacterium]|nr:PHP domain-containing protein [Acidimicrobiales bacterium]